MGEGYTDYGLPEGLAGYDPVHAARAATDDDGGGDDEHEALRAWAEDMGGVDEANASPDAELFGRDVIIPGLDRLTLGPAAPAEDRMDTDAALDMAAIDAGIGRLERLAAEGLIWMWAVARAERHEALAERVVAELAARMVKAGVHAIAHKAEVYTLVEVGKAYSVARLAPATAAELDARAGFGGEKGGAA